MHCIPGVASANPGFLIIMTLLRAHLFIDGSNCYHALKQNNLYYKFTYDSFFNELSKKFNITGSYYYDAIKNIKLEPVQYAKQQEFHARLQKSIPKLVIQTRKLKYLFKNDRLDYARHNANFCKNCDKRLDPFLSEAGLLKLSKEKGVDILLATDMIKGGFQNRFDLALLVSGDADYVPAVELVQTLKKEVINVHFYSGSASELRRACNSHLLIQIDETGKCFFQ